MFFLFVVSGIFFGEKSGFHPCLKDVRDYGAFETPIRDDFLVNDDTTGFIWQSTQGMDVDSSGNRFILIGDYRGGYLFPFLYIFDSSENPVAGPIKIGNYAEKMEMAVSPDGKALVAWSDNYYIWIAIYDAQGNEVLSPVPIDSGVSGYYLDVASNGLGEYAVAYDSSSGDEPKFVRINASGNPVSSFLYSGASARNLRISMDNSGNVVMVWYYYDSGLGSYETYYCLVDASGTVVAEGIASSVSTGSQYYPDVWMDEENGDFWIAWLDTRTAYYDIYLRHFDSSGSPTDVEALVNDGGAGTVSYSWPHVSLDGSSGWGFVVGWADDRNGDRDVYIQRYDATGTPSGTNIKVNSDIGYGQSSVFVGVGANGDWGVLWEDERYETEIAFIRFFLPDGTSPHAEFPVDENKGSRLQMYASCGLDDEGGIIVWMDTRYSWNGDIFAQLIDTLGNPVGTNFIVADDTTGEAYSPDVTVNGGTAVIIWVDTRSGSYHLYGQRYGMDGTPYGSNFQISRASLASSIYGVAADRNGNFAAVWHRNDDNIMLRRYNNAGIPLTDTIVVNDVRDNAGYPDVAMDPNGNFVVVWNDWHADGTYDVYMQLFDSTGNRIGTNITVVDRTADVYLPRVARSRAGFVVVWADMVDGGWKIYAQRYQNNGNPVGTPFPVSSDTIPSMIFYWNLWYWSYGVPAAVTIDSLGNFLVGWITAGDQGDPDFVVRGFYSDGTPMGPEVIVNNEPVGDETQLTLGNSAIASYGNKVLLAWGDARRYKGIDIYAELNTFDLAGIGKNVVERRGTIFSERYTVSFYMDRTSEVRVTVYNLSGRAVYHTSGILEAGTHTFTWKPRNLPSGVYFVVIDKGNEKEVRKAIYLR